MEDFVPDIRGILTGDVDAFEPIVRVYHSPLRCILLSRGVPRSDLDDLEQEVFLCAFRYLVTFDKSRPFWPWLRKIGWRMAAEHLKRRARRARTEGDAVSAKMFDLQAAGKRDIAENVLEIMKGCLEILSERAQRLISLHYAEGLTSFELAPQENLSSSGIRNVLCRARLALRECIKRTLGLEENSA